MERLCISKYNDKFKKIKIDEIENLKNDDSFSEQIYKIAMNNLIDNSENFSEEDIDEKIEFNKNHIELFLSSSINSNSVSITNSLNQSNSSSHSDKTDASSELHNKCNDLNMIENYDYNNDIFKRKIDITNIISGEDKRTMIEINKIPKKYANIRTIKDELNDKGFKGKFDYIDSEIIDRYNNDINNIINTNYKKIYINFVEPLHIILFYYLYQKKYFNYKGNINEVQYSEHFPKKNICLESTGSFKNNSNNANNLKKSISNINKIEIPKEYLNFYKKVNPYDVCINSKDNYFGIDTFIVKKNNNKK